MTNEILNDAQLDSMAGGNGTQTYDDMNSYIYVDEVFVGNSSQQRAQFRSRTENQNIAANNYKRGHFIL